MRIEFAGGDVMQGNPNHVTLVVDKRTLSALREVLTYVALHEAKLGHSQFANDLLVLENELMNSVVSENG